MNIKAVLFDLDGTLLDSALDFIAILQQMRNELGLPAMASHLIRQQVSAGANAMVELALEATLGSDDFDMLKEDFLQRYHAAPCTHSRLFEGLPELLDALEQRKIRWGIATNKPERFVQPIIRSLQLEQRASVVLCPEHVEQPKPAPDMLLLACEQLGIQPGEAIYLGDDQRDILAARAAAMPSMAVGYGYHSADENPQNWGADHYVKNPTQLASKVLALL